MRTYEYTLHRMVVKDSPERPIYTANDAVAYLLENCFRPEESYRENCWLLLLDSSHRIFGMNHLSMGGINETSVDIKIACKVAIDALATAVIIAHNHPSGIAKTSKVDVEMTDRLKKAMSVLDIALLDHIIIGDGSYYSFADEVVKPLPKN